MLPLRPRSRRLASVLILLLTPIYYWAPWHASDVVSQVLGLPFLLLYAVLLPGALLMHWLSPRRYDWLERATSAALFGLALFLLCAFLWALTGTGLMVFRLALPVAWVGIAVFSLLSRQGDAADDTNPRGRPVFAIALSALLVVLFVLVLRSGIPISFTKDTMDHIGYTREIRESGEAFPNTAFYADAGSNGMDMRKGLMNVVYGFSADYLGLAPDRFLIDINAIFAVLMIMAVYAMALIFFNDRRIAVVSAVLFVIGSSGGLGSTRLAFFPSRFAIVFYFYFLVYALRYMNTRARRDLAPCAVFAFAACATHVFYAVLIAIAGAVLVAGKPFFPQYSWREHIRRLLPPGAAALLGLLPYVIYRYVAHSPQANELHAEVQGVVFLTRHLYIAGPFRVLAWWGPVGTATFLAVFALWRRRGTNSALGFLMASYVAVPLILLNPLLFPPLHMAITYLAFRLIFVCPFYVLTACFLVEFFDRWPSHRLSARVAVMTTIVLFACLLELRPVFRGGPFTTSRAERERRASYLLFQDGITFLDEQIPENSVVASDPLTSYSIPAFTSGYVVCTLDQHAPPNDLDLENRIEAARDISSPYVSVRRTTELLSEHGATHVVLNNRIPPSIELNYWAMESDIFPSVVAKFEAHPSLFELLYDHNDFLVFRWSGEVGGPDSIPANPYLLPRIPGDFNQVGSEAGDAVLEGARLDREQASPGDDLTVSLVWSGTGCHKLAMYVVVIRFDHMSPDLPLGGRPFPKVTRKIKEKLSGRLYRVRYDHKIQHGFLGPDTWQAEDLVLDETRIRLPRNMSPGRYGVFVKLLAVANQPNLSIRDFLYDDDIYQGIKAAEITIR